MTNIEDILGKVGFTNVEGMNIGWTTKEIKLRDGRDAILWVNTQNGHGILDPEFWISKEEYEADYRKEFSANINNKTSPQDHANIYASLNKRQYNQFKDIMRRSDDVLEVGSSFGGIVSNMYNRPFIESKTYHYPSSITAVEPNKEDASYIEDNYGDQVDVRNDFFTEYSDCGKKFDLIVSFEVLEHIEKPMGFIKGLFNNLKEGGKVNIEVPNHHDAGVHVFKNKSYTDFYYHKAHIHYFTPQSLELLFNVNGFKGYVEGFQMYTAPNQLSWLYTNKPQCNATIALGYPEGFGPYDTEYGFGLSNVIDNFNDNYIKFVETNRISDCIVYKGKKEI